MPVDKTIVKDIFSLYNVLQTIGKLFKADKENSRNGFDLV